MTIIIGDTFWLILAGSSPSCIIEIYVQAFDFSAPYIPYRHTYSVSPLWNSRNYITITVNNTTSLGMNKAFNIKAIKYILRC